LDGTGWYWMVDGLQLGCGPLPCSFIYEHFTQPVHTQTQAHTRFEKTRLEIM